MVLILLSIFLKVKGTENENRKLPVMKKLDSMDPLGCILFIGSVCCLLFALEWGGQSKPWGSPTVIGLLVGFVTLTSLFAYLQWRRKEKALIPLRVLRKRSIFTSAMVLFFLGASTYLVPSSTRKLGELKADMLHRMFFSFHSIFRLYEVSIPSPVVKISFHFCCPRWWP